MNNKKLIESIFDNIISLEARNVKLGHGSFITLGFGKDIAFEITVRQKKEINHKPEWDLWVYMCFWELKMNNEIVACSDDERDDIEKALKHIENKKLLKVEVLSDNYDMQFDFEGGISLHLFSNLKDDYKQWMLFTPDNKVLTAGPYQNLTYELDD